MVIILHVSSNAFSSSDRFIWNAANLYESFTRTCVPLFFMITGALLCKARYDFRSIKGRIIRILIPLVFWSVIYLIFFFLLYGSSVSFTNLIIKPAAGHLWYLYALIGVYVTIPILCFVYQNSNLKLKIYVSVLWFISCIVSPSLKGYGLSLNQYFDVSTIGLYQGYFFIGSLLADLPKHRWIRIAAFASFIITSILILIFTKYLFDTKGLHDTRYYTNSSTMVCVASISIFLSLHNINIKGKFLSGLIYYQSRYTFGIYLSHLMFIYLIVKFGTPIDNNNAYYFIPISAFATYFISLSLCYILGKLRMGAFIN